MCLAMQVDFMPVYAEHLRNIIKEGVSRQDNYDRPLEGFKVAVDPGNGAGGYFATDVLAPLGCDVSGDCCFHIMPPISSSSMLLLLVALASKCATYVLTFNDICFGDLTLHTHRRVRGCVEHPCDAVSAKCLLEPP